MTLQLDYSNMMISPGGIIEDAGARPAGQFAAAKRGFDRARQCGDGRICRLAAQRGAARSGDELRGAGARQVRRRRHSRHRRLGARPDRSANRAPAERMEHAGRKGAVAATRACTCSTTSIPRRSPRCLGALKLSRTLFIVTSKSGGTAETMAQFLIVYDRLVAEKLDVTKQIVFVTDPKQGALRPLADRLKVPALDIPRQHRGRFSVLTPVGTLPAALIGIDVRALLAGAGEMAQRCASTDLASNPAGVYAMLQWLADTKLRKAIAVFMPYSDPLGISPRGSCSCGRRVSASIRSRWDIRRVDPTRRARRHRPARTGAALHGRSSRQDRHLRRGRRPRYRRTRSRRVRGREGARLPRRAFARRAHRHRAARHRWSVGEARAAQHDDSPRSRGRRSRRSDR